MKKSMIGMLVLAAAFLLGRVPAQDVEPSCPGCPSTYISAEEIEEYVTLGQEQTGRCRQNLGFPLLATRRHPLPFAGPAVDCF